MPKKNTKTIITNSEEETGLFAFELGKKSKPGDIFALRGDLGCGKTILAKGIAKGLGIEDNITSPTFTLMEVYSAEVPLYHFDLYRIESEDELDNLFFEEYWEGDGVSVIEWAERAGERLPESRINIDIEYIDDSRRRIRIEYPCD